MWSLLFSIFFLASANNFPKNWCSTGRCSPPQIDIFNAFNEGSNIMWDQMPAVISGACYHSSRYYNNEHKHYSGFIIDQESEGFSFSGKHSYFAAENPYAHLNLKEARQTIKQKKDLRVESFEGYEYYNATPEEDYPIRYWFRLGQDSKIKMAVIFQTLDYFALCDLETHSE